MVATPSNTPSHLSVREEAEPVATPTKVAAASSSTPSPTPTVEATETVPTPSATVAAPSSTPNPVPPSEGDGNANVVYVEAVQAENGSWTFHVTVEHPDTGWEDYADGWDVVAPDGDVLKRDGGDPFTRLLAHPHVNEQPFRRSQGGIVIPAGVTWVRVRAHDLVDGWGGAEIIVDLTVTEGEEFEVKPLP